MCTFKALRSANKLTGTSWGDSPSTLRSTALALCYSTAEYACPVWERSALAKKFDPAINATCRLITGCLKPTPTDSLYILSGIAPPDIRRSAASSRERKRQTTDGRHPLFGQVPANKRLKSRRSFLGETVPIGTDNTRVKLWEERRTNLPTATYMCLRAKEDLPPGSLLSWSEWKCLNRLTSGTGRCKVTLQKWGYLDNDDVTCVCGLGPQTMEH